MFPGLLRKALQVLDGKYRTSVFYFLMIPDNRTEYLKRKAVQQSVPESASYFREKFLIREGALKYILSEHTVIPPEEKPMWRDIVKNIFACGYVQDKEDEMFRMTCEWKSKLCPGCGFHNHLYFSIHDYNC
jgi:hypothetical protein